MSLLSRVPFCGVLKNPRGSTISSRLLPRNHQTKPKKRMTSYLLDKYVSFVKYYEKSLEKKFPAAMKFYQVFSVGLKYFKDDTLILFRGFKKVNTQGWLSLSRKELEIYYKMPKGILKTAPLLILAGGVPFCGFIFAIAYYFPRQMLTDHFWSLQQKSEFSLYFHKKRLQHFRPVFRCMQKQLDSLKGNPLYEPMKEMLDCLGSGVHPPANLILTCKPLFESCPYGLNHLSRSHTLSLLRVHSMHRGWRRKKRLQFRAFLIHLLDEAIIKEGGLEKLTQDEIKWNCFIRGLNPINMRQEDIIKWLNTWMAISQQIDEKSYSLLLHCPLLLGYNQPSNWWLLHDKR